MYKHWASGGATPVLEEVRAALHGEDIMQRQYEGVLDMFAHLPLASFVDAGEVVPIINSPQQLHVLRIEFVNEQTGNMFFVVYQDTPVLLHFYVQSGSSSSVSSLHLVEAEARAAAFWAEVGAPLVNQVNNLYARHTKVSSGESRPYDDGARRGRGITGSRCKDKKRPQTN